MTAIPSVDGLAIGAALRRAAERRPDGDALVFPQAGFRASYAEFDARVDGVARALLALGEVRGDHVAVWATNWPEWTLQAPLDVLQGPPVREVRGRIPPDGHGEGPGYDDKTDGARDEKA